MESNSTVSLQARQHGWETEEGSSWDWLLQEKRKHEWEYATLCTEMLSSLRIRYKKKLNLEVSGKILLYNP
jgi:hypothetical protein